MRRTRIDDKGKWYRHKGAQFMLLGTKTTAGKLPKSARDRLMKMSGASHADLWGTLGRWDKKSPEFVGGVVQFSGRGNEHSGLDDSGEETVELIQQTRAGMPDNASRIRERFIDLRKTEFSNLRSRYSLDDPPSLQLTVLVEPGEGALVNVIHGSGEDEWAELVQPESTPRNTCSGRDRLHYRVGLWPTELTAWVDKKGKKGKTLCSAGAAGQIDTDMVIKVLTFRRQNSSSAQVVRRALGALGRDKYGLLKWNPGNHCFEAVSESDVDRKAKTLMMIHGTFSSTSGSFGKLIEGGGNSWLSDAHRHQRYGQILAFDHDTVLDDVATNAQYLRAMTPAGFAKPLDVLTHSRGGLVAKRLAIYESGYEIKRGVLGACANGVGYLTLARNLSLLLSVLRRMGRFSAGGGVAAALGQHSIDFVRKLPGLDAMNPGGERLKSVAKKKVPASRSQPKFLPLVGDWDPPRRWKRWAGGPIDAILKPVLGNKHDWVVGSKEQAMLHPSHIPAGFDPDPYSRRMHTRYYYDDKPKRLARRYLLEGVVKY